MACLTPAEELPNLTYMYMYVYLGEGNSHKTIGCKIDSLDDREEDADPF